MTINGKDTVCTVSINTVRSYNNAIQDLDACNILADSLWSQNQRLYRGNVDDQNIIKTQELEITQDNIAINGINDLKTTYKKDAEQHEKKISWLKIQRNILAIPALIGTGVVIYEVESLVKP